MADEKSVILLGSGGMLAHAVEKRLDALGIPCLALNAQACDITSDASVNDLPPANLVINCAAWTDVDGAEDHEAEATEVNGHAVGRIADWCRRRDATLVHFSTDYVFNGVATDPWPIDAPREPVNAYGRSKLVGEQQLEASGASHLLIRTSWLYAPWGNNFVLTMRRLLAERDELRVVADQTGRPTSAEQLTERSIDLAHAGVRGTFHICDEGTCTWHEFASEINDITGLDARVTPCTTDEFPRPAKRPAWSVLDLNDANRIMGPARHWKDELRRVIHNAQLATPNP